MEQDRFAAVEKVLGAPFSGDFSENALKVRRNLLACCFVALVLTICKVQIDPNPTVLGVKFIGVSDSLIYTALFVLIVYFFFHFLLFATEAFLEWRIRLTGQRTVAYTGSDLLEIGSTDKDWIADSHQATLYSWWITHKDKFDSLSAVMQGIVSDFEKRKIEGDPAKTDALKAAISDQELQQIKHAASILSNTYPRLESSLKRFDAWFCCSLRIQTVRWISVDIGLPVIMGLMSLWLLYPKAFVFE